MNILFTICGRAGSKGLVNKNLKRMNGIPLVYYTLAAIKGYADKYDEDNIFVAINSDSSQLVEYALKQDSIPITVVKREEQFAGDLCAKVDVIKDTYSKCSQFNLDAVVDLDITSPLRTVADIENAIAEYKKGIFDIVFSVVESRRSPYFNMVEIKEDGFYRKICNSSFTARQQAPKTYELNASIYVYKPEFLESDIKKTILDYNCGISVMNDYLVLDIDSEDDFDMMQALYSTFCKTHKGISDVYEIAGELAGTSIG